MEQVGAAAAVLCQELVRFNGLVEVIHASLKSLQKALRGQVSTSILHASCKPRNHSTLLIIADNQVCIIPLV